MFARGLNSSLRSAAFRRTHPTALSKTRLSLVQPVRREVFSSSSSARREIFSSGWTLPRYMAILALLFSGAGISIAAFGYSQYRALHSSTRHYPSPVAAELRKALYHALPSSSSPRESVAHFRAALGKAAEVGLRPTSDEVTGIKIELARVLAEYGRADKAVEVLEHVLDEVVAAAAGEEEEEEEGGADRARLLKRAVSVAAKISDMYLDMDRPGQAEEPLVWAVDTALAESRKVVKRGDGKKWMEDKEMAMVLENLAALYERTDRFALASPLYLLALEYMPPGDCHSVILMNNLSTSLAQQPVGNVPVTRQQLVADSATPWAQKALKLAETIRPPARTDECDLGCAFAIHNLAEFAEMLGDVQLARRRYLEAKEMAESLGIKENVERAEEGLKRIGEKS